MAHCTKLGLPGPIRTVITHFDLHREYTRSRSKSGEVPTNQQAATISVAKPGFVEKNLHRQGDLNMADRMPTADEWAWGVSRKVVLPGKPYLLDFVLVPAASLDGELLDARGKPIAEKQLWITGKELPPSSSVLRGAKTDAQGHFAFEEIPPGFAWWVCSDRVMRPTSALPL